MSYYDTLNAPRTSPRILPYKCLCASCGKEMSDAQKVDFRLWEVRCERCRVAFQFEPPFMTGNHVSIRPPASKKAKRAK